jgi:hypothetical protein
MDFENIDDFIDEEEEYGKSHKFSIKCLNFHMMINEQLFTSSSQKISLLSRASSLMMSNNL